jgi:hypothetical protein
MAKAERYLIPPRYELFTRAFIMPSKVPHIRRRQRQNIRRHKNAGGRPVKPDKDEWGQITCVLKHETIEKLRAGAGGERFGWFLQEHLDNYPPPSKRVYLKRKRMPVIMAEAAPSRKEKLAAKEQARREKLTPEERAWEDSLRAAVTKTVEEVYAER